MGVLMQVCCIFPEQLFLRTPLGSCFRLLEVSIQDLLGLVRPVLKALGKHPMQESSDYLMNHFCTSKHISMLMFLKIICHTLGAHDVKGKVITWVLLY